MVSAPYREFRHDMGPVAAVETWGFMRFTVAFTMYINLYPAYGSLHILPQSPVTVAAEHVVYSRILFLVVTDQSRDIFDTDPGFSSTTLKSDYISQRRRKTCNHYILETLWLSLYGLYFYCSIWYILISKVAEKTFLLLRKVSEARSDVHCIAVSHSEKAATEKWLEAVGGAGNVEIVVDHERKLYGQYGLGVASAWHVLNPWSMADVFKLAREERIKNRPTESGTRWQTAGTFAIDSHGEVQYVQVAQQASENGDFDKALHSLEKP